MKKIGSILLIAVLAVALISCNKNKFYAKVKLIMETGDTGKTEIDFRLSLEDPDSQVENTIFVKLKDKDGKTVKEDETTKDGIAEQEFNFSGLTIDTQYSLVVTTTWNDSERTLLTTTVSTREITDITITTTEEFLKIKNDSYGSYLLANDLDFTDVSDEDLKSGYITTFRGSFDGQGHSIKNYRVNATTSSNLGLFGQLSSSAVVKNLVVDGIKITQKDTDNITNSRYAGMLFGQNISSSVTVDNITIKSSLIELTVNSSDVSLNTISYGMLGGTASGKISNITIEDDNKIVANFKSIANTYIGGVIGQTKSSSVEITNIKNAGEIILSITQDNENGLKGVGTNINVAGFIADVSEAKKLDNVVTKTDIKVANADFVVSSLGGDDEKKNNKDRNLTMYVGGLFATIRNKMTNMVYSGNIDVAEFTLENGLSDEETLKYKYIPRLSVGSIAAYTGLYSTSVTKVVRYAGIVKVATQSIEDFVISHHTLFGIGKNVVNSTVDWMGYYGTINDTIQSDNKQADPNVFEIIDFDSFFGVDSWIIENFS